jgi:hypothetical protein
MRKWLFGGVAVSFLPVFASGASQVVEIGLLEAGGLRENKRYGWVHRT